MAIGRRPNRGTPRQYSIIFDWATCTHAIGQYITRTQVRKASTQGSTYRRLANLHVISSTVMQLCPDGDPKVIRLLSEGFLAGVKGDRTRLSLQYSRLTAVYCAISRFSPAKA